METTTMGHIGIIGYILGLYRGHNGIMEIKWKLLYYTGFL